MIREYDIDARNIKNPFYPAPLHMRGGDQEGIKQYVRTDYLTKLV